MALSVIVLPEAESDLDLILAYVAEKDGQQRAAELVLALQEACAKLAEFPHRGTVLTELSSVDPVEYRQVHYKPYRIIYEVAGERVFIHAVLDGRRDMETLLRQRLLR